MAYDKVVDDGNERMVTETGAIREIPVGKGRFDLIPPHPLKRLAMHYDAGSQKYSARNWEKGLPLARFMDSTLRHINTYIDGDRSEDNLVAAIWNLFGYVHTLREIEEGRLPISLAEGAVWEKELMEKLSETKK
jgi:beta-glucosidase-like glycosyl hydrolase